jgi:cytochrome c553
LNGQAAHSNRSRWPAVAIALTLFVAFASIIVGFAWLPFAQPESAFRSVWRAFCGSAGLVWPRPASAIVDHPGYKTSMAVVSADMLPKANADSIGQGGTLALQCTMCHGDRGRSDANTPSLAGQYAPAIYKQLLDYRSGARINAIMSPRVANLTDRDMRDLAAYFASLPRLAPYHPVEEGNAPEIVAHGAPMRNIPPCATCHGTVAYKIGTEWLEGESARYLRTQLEAFASGSRHNDINEQMRNVARGMRPEEMQRAAAYFSSHYPDPQ